MLNIDEFLTLISNAENMEALDNIYSDLFSKNGFFTLQMKAMNSFSVEEKKEKGKLLNTYKTDLQNAFFTKKEHLILDNIKSKMLSEKVDLTLPVKKQLQGGIHPLSYVVEQTIAIFADAGFKVATGPEIETDWNNFTALNIPFHHPARQEHDTFYMESLDENDNRNVLRTHTSTVQIRTMTDQKEDLEKGNPIKIIAPGRTYRSDSDATHSPMFHQIEGLYVDKKENVSVKELKSILMYFCSKFFDVENLPIRLRPSYFPFTSPSYEIDILCDKSKDNLIIGKGKDWLEILGCGIVHPNVLENCGIDSTTYAGYAFGMGIERITMLKYGFRDLRHLYEGNYKWLSYYNFNMIKMPTTFGGLD